ncbi:MAG: hypothetical protein AAGI34_04710 [Pseudomonadota bacterium]
MRQASDPAVLALEDDPHRASVMLAAGGFGEGAARDIAALFLAATLDGVETAAPLPPGPKLFLCNHQIALDLLYLAAWLNGPAATPARVAAWDGVGSAHPGELITRLAALGAATGALGTTAETGLWFAPLLFDSRDPAGLAAFVDRLGVGARRGQSLIVTAEGLRHRADAEPVRQVGTAFVEAALAAGMAVVPVRFAWALPEISQGHRFAWPWRLAPMRILLGQAMTPDALAPLHLAERRDCLAGAINALYRPPPDGHYRRNSERTARVARLQAGFGISETKALAIDLLLSAPLTALSPEGTALRQALTDHQAPLWTGPEALAEFALYLSDGGATLYPLLHQLYGQGAHSGQAWARA